MNKIILPKNATAFAKGVDSYVYTVKINNKGKISFTQNIEKVNFVIKVYKSLLYDKKILKKYIEIHNFLSDEVKFNVSNFKIIFEKFQQLVNITNQDGKIFIGAIQPFVSGENIENILDRTKNEIIKLIIKNSKNNNDLERLLEEEKKRYKLLLEINEKIENILTKNGFKINMWIPFTSYYEEKFIQKLFNKKIKGCPQLTTENIKKSGNNLIITDIAGNIEKFIK